MNCSTREATEQRQSSHHHRPPLRAPVTTAKAVFVPFKSVGRLCLVPMVADPSRLTNSSSPPLVSLNSGSSRPLSSNRFVSNSSLTSLSALNLVESMFFLPFLDDERRSQESWPPTLPPTPTTLHNVPLPPLISLPPPPRLLFNMTRSTLLNLMSLGLLGETSRKSH